MTQRSYLLCLGLTVLVALMAQCGLFGAGLFRITADESARILTAWHLNRSNAFEPFLWPPFYKLFVGAALKIYPSVFFTPRLLVSIVGLVCLLSVAWLAMELFADRTISVIAAVLAILAPQRLIFSVAPLSDIYYFVFIVSAAAATARWLRTARTPSLMLACVFLLLAETVRFEGGLFALFLELLLLHQWLIAKHLPFATLAAASLLLFGFPALWAVNSYVWYGSLSNLSVASQQFIGEFGRNLGYAIKWSPLRFFIQDMLWNPLTLPGLAVVAWLALSDRAVRLWALLYGVPLLVFSAVCIVTFSIPTAATWRTSGVWTLMMLPFDAFVAHRIGIWLWRSARLPRAALLVLLLLAILPMGVRSLWYARDGLHNNETHRLHQERALDRYLDRRLAASPSATVGVDTSTNLDYLDVLAFSRFPNRLITTGDGDPVRIGFYEPMRDDFAARKQAAHMLTDRFDLSHGGNAEALVRFHVRFLIVRNPVDLAALDKSALVTRIRQFNDWSVYAVKAPLLSSGVARGSSVMRHPSHVAHAG